jgi:hypothetical protein
MTSTDAIATSTSWMLRTGYAFSGLVILFMLLDVMMKLLRLPIVLETTLQLGWPAESALPLGVLLLACTALFAFPRTSMLGAVLLTGYPGGAVATHARIGSPLLGHTLFGVDLGVLMWAGLYLRDPRVRSLLPLAQ